MKKALASRIKQHTNPTTENERPMKLVFFADFKLGVVKGD